MTMRPESRASAGTHVAVAGRRRCASSEPVLARASIEARYVRRLRAFGNAPTILSDAIVQSMGFCSAHEAYIANQAPELRAMVDACKLLADARLNDMVERTHFQDHVIQDMIFGARLRCPVCSYLRRFEGRGVSMLFGQIERGSMTAHQLIGAMPNLEAARCATSRAPPPLRHALFVALRRRARKLIDLAALADGESRRGGSRSELARAIAHGGAGFGVDEAWRAASPCPVCQAIRAANVKWLRSVRDNFRLGQPLWLTFPGCPEHTGQALVALSDIPAGRLVEHFVDSYLHERPIVEASGARPRRRRKSDWLDAGRAPAGTATSPPWGDERLETSALSCPACRAEDIALRRAVAMVVKSQMKSDGRTELTHLNVCCAKHFSEVLIAAPGDLAHRWLRERVRTGGIFQDRRGSVLLV